jgi:hypothetical protein
MLETARPRPAPEYQAEILEGELVVFHPSSNKVLHSNPSAAVIWKLCDGRRSIAEITRILCEAFPESAEQIKKDVPEAIQLFVDNGVMALE